MMQYGETSGLIIPCWTNSSKLSKDDLGWLFSSSMRLGRLSGMLRVSLSIAWGKAVTKVTPSLLTTSFSNSEGTSFSLIVFGKGGSPTPSCNVLTNSQQTWTKLQIASNPFSSIVAPLTSAGISSLKSSSMRSRTCNKWSIRPRPIRYQTSK